MIEKSKNVSELWYIKHRNDKATYTGFDYENKLYSVTMSNLMFDNDILNEFLQYHQKQAVWMLESTLVIRNFWNYTVDKYYGRHIN